MLWGYKRLLILTNLDSKAITDDLYITSTSHSRYNLNDFYYRYLSYRYDQLKLYFI